jgi:hypothetical protein
MAITRAQASAVLNQSEMRLYDESRANAVRGLRVADLERRIERSRTARDRARDQLKRQKLASRSRTGSKAGASGNANARSERKAEVLADVLKRFEAQVRIAKQAEREAARAEKAGARGATGTKTSARTTARTTAKTTAKKATKTATRTTAKTATRKTSDTASRAPSRKAASKTAAGPSDTGATPRTRRKRGDGAGTITPEQALENTRKLLERKQARARETPAWQEAVPAEGATPEPGYQSNEAQGKAYLLHDAESRLQAIGGSVGTRDRINQGKRDRRRSGD